MPSNKQQMLRIQKFVAMMKENRWPNCKTLIAAMQKSNKFDNYRICQKTVQRDIEFLNKMGARIDYDRTHKGYFLANTNWTYSAPMLSDEGMEAVVLGARLAECLMPQPIADEIRQSADSFILENEKGLDETACLLALVATGARIQIKPEIFKEVFSAWHTHHALNIKYRKPGHNTVDNLLIEPQVLVFHEGLWYLKAICLQTNNIWESTRKVRTLAVHRITAANVVAGKFESDMKLINEVNRGGVFNFPTIPEVILRFSGNAVSFASENYPASAIQQQDDGSLLITVHNAVDFKIINLVLNENGNVQIVSPPELAKKVITQAQKVIRLQKIIETSL